MKTDAQTLPTDVLALQQMVAKLQRELDAKDAKYQRLLEQFRLAQHQRFGANGEAHPGQGELFNEAEDILSTEDTEPESDTTTVTYERKQAKRKPLPADSERIVMILMTRIKPVVVNIASVKMCHPGTSESH